MPSAVGLRRHSKRQGYVQKGAGLGIAPVPWPPTLTSTFSQFQMFFMIYPVSWFTNSDDRRPCGRPRKYGSIVSHVSPTAAFFSLVLVAAGAAGAGGSERIRLHGIDAPESAQRCRAGGKTWAVRRSRHPGAS